MATSKEYNLGEFTYPRGWFMIATSEQLNTHKPLALTFFGKEFCLYRGLETGKVVLMDAYCPHMKTHLAAPNDTSYVIIDGGGTNVEGDGIRCHITLGDLMIKANAMTFLITMVRFPKRRVSKHGPSLKV